MKIAQIAPIIESVPPKKYGGTERVVHTLTEELVRMGHDVTLFASGDSVTSAKLISVVPKSLREMFPKNKMNEVYGMNYWTVLHIGIAYQMQDKFDVIHDHTNHYGLLASISAQTPVVKTLHGAFDEDNKMMYQTLKTPYYVTISNAQATPVPKLNRLGTVYNGLSMQHYPFSATNNGFLLFVGRINIEKGVHLAIEVAKKVGLPLIIAAKLDTSYDPDIAYFKKYIKPQLSDQIRWIGEVNEDERNQLMSKALAFLHPVTWPEPFGLTLIEAMACGCPIIAIAKGSIPEVVADGKTGFVVQDVDGMIKALEKIQQIDRKYCREYALTHFSAQRMAKGYLETYRQAIEKNKQKNKPILISPTMFPDQANLFSKPYSHTIYPRDLRSGLKPRPRLGLSLDEEE